MPEPLLDVRGLRASLRTDRGEVIPVDDVSFALERGGALGLVGESGCGKTMLALSLMRLLPRPGRIVGGSVLLEGRELLGLPESEMRLVRGARLAMIFQEPMTSLNPVFTVGDQIGEAVKLHQRVGRVEARERTIGALREVGIPAPEVRVDSYPHELSGGMRQRVMIAMALACRADVLIADEPTTALDATVQLQILELLESLRRRRGLSLILVSHDLGLVASNCEEVLVMYAGRVVERARAGALFRHPAHPYTRALLDASPVAPREPGQGEKRTRLKPIPGRVPALAELPAGCAFAPRCSLARGDCASGRPELARVQEGQSAACRYPLTAHGAEGERTS